MTNTIVGIDVSKATLDIVLLNGKTSHNVFENSPKGFIQLQNWLEKHQAIETHSCLEATGQYAFR